jgi:polar amino acid transport system substrate-binding protein
VIVSLMKPSGVAVMAARRRQESCRTGRRHGCGRRRSAIDAVHGNLGRPALRISIVTGPGLFAMKRITLRGRSIGDVSKHRKRATPERRPPVMNPPTRQGRSLRTIALPAIILLLTSLAGTASGQSGVASDIAPQGKLRAAILSANPILMTKKPDGSNAGVAIDLGTFIAERLGVPFDPVLYPTAEAYAGSFGKGEWDIAIGARGTRAETVDYTPDFLLVDNIFVAAPGREFADVGQVDRPGVKVAVVKDGPPDRFLSRTLKAAEIVRIPSNREAIETLRSGQAHVYGSNGQLVHRVAEGLPGAKIVPGSFNTVPQTVALPKGRPAAAQRRLAEIVDDAKRTGVMQRAVEQAGIKGVRVAPH